MVKKKNNNKKIKKNNRSSTFKIGQRRLKTVNMVQKKSEKK